MLMAPRSSSALSTLQAASHAPATLLSQSLTEWTQESETRLQSYAVCSDSDVGKKKAIAAYKELMDKHFTPQFLKHLDEWIVHTRDGLAAINKDWAKSFEADAKANKERMTQRMAIVKRDLAKLK